MSEAPSSIEDKKMPESKDSILAEVKSKLKSLLTEIGFNKGRASNKPAPEGPGTTNHIIDSTPGGNVAPDTGAPGFDANNVAPHTQSTTNTPIAPGQYQPGIDGVAPTPGSGIPISTNPNW